MEINNCMLKYAKHTHVTRGTYKQPTANTQDASPNEEGSGMSPAIPAPPGRGSVSKTKTQMKTDSCWCWSCGHQRARR